MDRHENWQTRMVLIVDGLDSCEQGKVLQVVEAINLIIPEDSPFIVLLALDPHIIIKGIEANQMQVYTSSAHRILLCYCMYTCLCVTVCVHVCVLLFVCYCMCTCLCVTVCLHVCVLLYVYMFVCYCLCVTVCVHVCVLLFVCYCLCVTVCVHVWLKKA